MDLGNGSLGKQVMNKVYVGMCADLIHHGHLNIIKEAKKYGFIVMDSDGKDLFVHYDDIKKAGVTKE